MEALNEKEEVSISELVTLCATDDDLYSHVFFPKTAREKSPVFHHDIDDALNGPNRYVAVMIFRGGAKTTKLRLYVSKLIAYGIAHTILYVSKSQDHARRSVEWLMTQVEYNTMWAQTFGLRKGKKWTSEEIEIYHGTDEHPIRIIALGITGSTRGVNVDDRRPDIIVVDDPSDEENTATPEQREKTDDFINGSLRNSLAPASEAPHAKMVFLQTLLHEEDSIARCENDPAWTFLKFSVFDDRGESRWPDRWSTEELKKEKESFIARGKLHLWMREMECKVVSNELSAFQNARKDLKYWEVLPPLNECVAYMAVDPVPPPSDRELEKGLKGKDWEVWTIVLKHRRNIYVAEQRMERGHDPTWSIAQFFELKDKYPTRKCRVESVAYQRTLKVAIEQAMKRRGVWMQITDGTRDGKADRRKKSYRIIDSIGAVLAEGRLFVHASMTVLIDQIFSYPAVSNDDAIESAAMAIDEAERDGNVYEGDYSRIEDEEALVPDLEFGGCP